MGKSTDKTRKIPVYLPPRIYEIVVGLQGTIGKSKSEVVKNIIIIYLTERGLLRDAEHLIDKEVV